MINYRLSNMNRQMKKAYLPKKRIPIFANDIDFLAYVNPYRQSLLTLAQEKVSSELEAQRLVMQAILTACQKRYQMNQRSDIFAWLKKNLQAQLL